MKTTKETRVRIRDSTKLISARFVDVDFAKDAALKYVAALSPESVTGLLDDLDTLEAELKKLGEDKASNDRDYIKLSRNFSWQSEMLERARCILEGMFDGVLTEKDHFEPARKLFSDLDKGPTTDSLESKSD